jgi:hypothetical protein
LETWPSGRRHTPAKGASGQNLDPGFESLRLRQNTSVYAGWREILFPTHVFTHKTHSSDERKPATWAGLAGYAVTINPRLWAGSLLLTTPIFGNPDERAACSFADVPDSGNGHNKFAAFLTGFRWRG